LDPLWRLAGDLRTTPALALANNELNFMCGPLRFGRRAATNLRIGYKPECGGHHIVLLPRPTGLTSLNDIIRLARRALVPGGRLVAGVKDAAARRALIRRLRLNGFSGFLSVNWPGCVLFRGDLWRP
jgi:hypothetical protein